jgi:nitrite reductase/ring-hydroxylating ferredoxin subunit
MRARLSEGRVEAGVVTCGWHGWRFDLRSGACLNKSWAAVPTYPLRIEQGEVWIGLPA